MPETSDLFEIMRTTRSMRRLKPDPVPDELIRKILEAGTCAPSGGNMQRWRFLVVKDPEVKRMVGGYYKRERRRPVAIDTELWPRIGTLQSARGHSNDAGPWVAWARVS